MFERFFKKNTATNTAVIEPGDRKSELLDEIRDLDGALENQDATMRAFRVEHTAVINGHGVLLFARDANIGQARADIAARWRSLCSERERIQAARNKVLAELARYL